MFYGFDYGDYRSMGQISDYRLDDVLKAKSINFYVQDVPMILSEASMHNNLIFALPKGLPYGVRVKVWSQHFPDTAFLGEMVSYLTPNDLGQSVETMIPYAEFDMKTVPWDSIIA